MHSAHGSRPSHLRLFKVSKEKEKREEKKKSLADIFSIEERLVLLYSLVFTA